MTNREIEYISQLIDRYYRIANIPNKLNNIVIEGNVISIIENGNILYKRELDVKDIKVNLDNIHYSKNVFIQSDYIYSPFEADKKAHKKYWKFDYNHIDFPKFLSVLLFSLLAVGKIPTIMEFCKIYMLAYTEAISPNNSNPMRFSLYAIPNVNDRSRIGQKIVFTDGQVLPNNLLRFKEKYKVFLSDFPINEVTTEHLCSRIYKVYGSAVRDIYNVLFFNEIGVKSYYDFLTDLQGIDLMIEGIPVFSYVDSENGLDFRQKKVQERHPHLADFGIALEKKVYSETKGGLYLINEDSATKVINAVNELKDSAVKKIVKVSF